MRTTIAPLDVAVATGIDPSTYALTSNVCGISTSGFSLFAGEDGVTTPDGFTVQIQAQYLDFLFSSYGATAREAVFNPTVGNDGIRSKAACIVLASGEPATYETYRRTRLAALRLVLRTVTCELDEDVRFGLMQFRYHGKGGDDNGGYVALPIESLKQSDGTETTYTLHGITDTHANHLARVISRVGPDAQTPLNESMFQAYTYFMSRDTNQLPPGRDYLGDEITTGEVFPVYAYNMDLHNPVPDEGGDLNLVGGHYVGNAITTTHPKPLASRT